MNQTLFIKNMVCPRCIEVVHLVFLDLELSVISLKLGNVTIDNSMTPDQKRLLKKHLEVKGFELLDDKQSQLIDQIKSIIIDQVHYNQDDIAINFSTLLSSKLNFDYSYLSRLFSSVEGRTIEKFIMAQKIEKVKELLTYGELTVSEIGYQMNYSSASYLSSQFKNVTGMSPSVFKKLYKKQRQFLNNV